ncbi:sulfurtransferase TusA family protein [Nonomuraea sp. M3C6]|uniref:Sulfurtransferase TusA family protein n=1 Tax=Nonomuraea marmarensis TaxID=3351344 RepID=A0ABW7AK95_9ACTN
MPDLVVDGGDKRCVQVLIELRNHVLGAAPGAVVHLITSDPAAVVDLPAWCHMTGHTYLGPVPGAARPTYAVRVGDGAKLTQENRPWHAA